MIAGRNGPCGEGLVLLYHRVTKLPTDPQLLCVHPRHFAEHLDVLNQRAAPMSLAQFTSALEERTLPERAVAVTFDDGYADNLEIAAPKLERFEVPASIFVTARGEDVQREFWWDELDRLLLQPGECPDWLKLDVGPASLHWDLGAGGRYGRDDFERCRSWNVMDRDTPGPRQEIYRALCERLRSLPHAARDATLDELANWAGRSREGRESHRSLDDDSIRRLSASDMIEVGAHTVTHPVLASLPHDEQRVEIEECKLRLEQALDRPVNSFSYPFGQRGDYDSESVRLTRQAGFHRACANVAGRAGMQSDRFQLPRMIVRDWDGDGFARRLEEWFGA